MCVCVCVLQHLPSTVVNTTVQLRELRERMLPWNISAYIIPGTDAHLVDVLLKSIYLSPCVRARVLVCDSTLLCFSIRVSTLHHVMRGWNSWLASQARQVYISASFSPLPSSSSSSSTSFSSLSSSSTPWLNSSSSSFSPHHHHSARVSLQS